MANDKNFKIKNGLALDDNKKIELGDSADLQIYHDGSTSFISDQGTGNLKILAQNFIVSNPANTETMIAAVPNGAAELYYDSAKKLATTSTGINVTGNATFADDGKAIFGAGSDLQIYHDGTNSYIRDAGTGELRLEAENSVRLGPIGSTENYALFQKDGAVRLYYDNAQKLATTSTGVDVTGNVSATGDIILEGSTADDFETTVTVTDPTADRTFTIPDQTGTAMLWQQPWPDDPADRNIAIGEGALGNIESTGQRNIAIGADALNDTTSGDYNTAIGPFAFDNLATGSRNTGVGYAVGSRSIANAVTDNTYIGYYAGVDSYGSSNTSIGSGAGVNTAASGSCVNVGYNSGYESGSYSVNIGYQAGYNTSMNSGSIGSVLVGYQAGDNLRTGDYNVLLGYAANTVSTSSATNVGIGKFITVGNSNNVNIGNQHYQSSTADRNVAIGLYSGGENSTTATTGDDNVAIGYYSGRWVQAHNNVFIGRNASGTGSAKTGNANCGIGYAALNSLSSGGSNSAYGNSAGYRCSTGSNNTYMGALAGGYSSTTGHATGSNCSFLGYNATPSSTSVSNEITLGDSNITSLRCNVTTISSLSDERDKTDIQDLPYGLDFINDMRPVQFTWDRRDGSMNNVPDFGFIAQDLHNVELEHSSTNRTRLVKWENPDKLEADYVRSYPILVKAVQELSAKCDALEARLAALEGV